MRPISLQLLELVIIAMPIACIAWTVTHEEIFREPREWCVNKSKMCRRIFQRKFFYLFTCEYCFSHYITLGAMLMTGYTLLLPGWRGSIIGFFSLVWLANVYMSLFGRLRLDIRHEREEIETLDIRQAREAMELKELQEQDSRAGWADRVKKKP